MLEREQFCKGKSKDGANLAGETLRFFRGAKMEHIFDTEQEFGQS